MQSPPIPDLDALKSSLKGKTAYMISKLGMTMAALGISEEYFSIEKPFTTIGVVSTGQHKLTQNR